MLKRIVQIVVGLLLTTPLCWGQATPEPSARPDTSNAQDKVKVFTEEIVISVAVYANGGSSPGILEPKDVLVFEDDVRQKVQSVRQVPANVLLALDTGGEMNPSMRVSTTRDIAISLISNL